MRCARRCNKNRYTCTVSFNQQCVTLDLAKLFIEHFIDNVRVSRLLFNLIAELLFDDEVRRCLGVS